jgi:hypothetical protein
MRTIYLAEFETRHYTFRCVSTSREACHESLKSGICWHCEQAGIDSGPLMKLVNGYNYNLRIMETGVLYRDSWPIGPVGTNAFAPGKDPKLVGQLKRRKRK